MKGIQRIDEPSRGTQREIKHNTQPSYLRLQCNTSLPISPVLSRINNNTRKEPLLQRAEAQDEVQIPTQ